MFEILLPIPFLAIGIGAIFFRDRFAEFFCRWGKALWKRSTFGLTDMAAFYDVAKTRRVFLLIGPVFLLVGCGLLWLAYAAFHGPGAMAAMREARGHLHLVYGSSSTWKVSASAMDGDGSTIVNYQYAGREGSLRATWDGERYGFEEMPPAEN